MLLFWSILPHTLRLEPWARSVLPSPGQCKQLSINIAHCQGINNEDGQTISLTAVQQKADRSLQEPLSKPSGPISVYGALIHVVSTLHVVKCSQL